MTTLPPPPPIRGDHRQTWLALTVVVVLFVAAVAPAVLVSPR